MKLLTDPNFVAGCYLLDLYCKYEAAHHDFNEFPHQHTDEHGSACRQIARRAGWILHRDGTATCPKCARALKRKEPGDDH